MVLAVNALEREVNNDGFDGLFRSSADVIPDLESALESIGRPDVAEIAAAAIAALGVSGVLSAETVMAAMDVDDDERDDRLRRLDERYYATAGDLAGHLLVYVRAATDSVVLP